MKKFLMALLLMVPVSAYAISVDVENDVSLISGWNDWTASVDQDGNEVIISTRGISFSNSDTVRIGIAYDRPLIWGLSGGTSVKYTTDSDLVLGLDTAFDYWGANLNTEFAWNINDADIDVKIGSGYTIFGLDGSVTSNWDIDDFSYEGMDITAGYTWAVTDTFSVRPNVTVPFDDDFSRGDLTAGLSISLSFGSTPSE